MVEQCDGECDSACKEGKADRYICLKSEAEYLSSFLRLGRNEQGKRNLLGYSPGDLIDWYLYVKRSFISWPSKDPFGWGLKLLDEVGKVLFGITQVTSKRPGCDDGLLLLRPQEQRLVKGFLGQEDADRKSALRIIVEPKRHYASTIGKLSTLSNNAGRALENEERISHWQEKYADDLECRIAYTNIQEIGTFHWEEYGTNVHLILRKLFEDEYDKNNRQVLDAWRSAKLKLACAYLHGVAQFALSRENPRKDNLGYWIDRVPDKPVESASRSNSNSSKSTVPLIPGGTPEYCLVPMPEDSKVRLSCELAASFAQEFWETSDLLKDNALFNVLFMCKEDSGWFWALANSQLDYLQNRVWNENDAASIMNALNRFRFKQAGIINHLEQTECLIEEVFDFRKEEYICTTVGYHLESAHEIANYFKSFEESLPGVETGSYFYFRITPHSKKKGTETKFLPQGALVAIFRFDRKLPVAEHSKYMAEVRQLVERWRAKVDSLSTVTEVVRKLSRPLQVKTARAAIMSRNFSHNVGSHSLANPHLHESIGIEDLADLNIRTSIKLRLEAFHSYTQGRLDFLSRAISESEDRPEPLFFLNDVLEKGFFSQGVLLDTLIEDTGFPASNIEFHVIIQKSDMSGFLCAAYKWQEGDRHQFIRDEDSDIEDVVVGIPGGMIGAHALYAFLENVMRNAAKYGNKLQQDVDFTDNLKIYLRVEQCEGARGGEWKSAWLLSIWDNVSSDDAKASVAKNIRRHINEDLIDDNGEMKQEGHGIQEMKLCGELLSSGMLFPEDRAGYNDEDPKSCRQCDGSCVATGEYRVSPNDFGVSIATPQPLRCYSAPHSDQCNHDTHKDTTNWLTYNLYIPIPILLGVVSPKHASNSAVTDKLPPHVRYYGSVDELAKHGSHIGILLDDGEQRPESILKDVALLHPCLPFRLMLVTSKAIGNGSEWAEKLQEKQVREDQPFKYPESIPNRRVRICGGGLGKELLSLLNPPDENAESELMFLGAGGKGQERWDAIVLRAYDAWLRVFKPLSDENNDAWKLCIGFAHGRENIVKHWKDKLTRFEGNKECTPCVQIHVVSNAAGNDGRLLSGNWSCDEASWEGDKDISYKEKRYLLFDNHGKMFSGFEGGKKFGEGVRFYQKIGLKDSLLLFQSLESPPQSAFSFSLFIYSLVEGALTRVVILDERLAQATLVHRRFDLDRLHRYQIADLFPLYNYRSPDTRVAISRSIENATSQVEERSLQKWKKWASALKHEGLLFGDKCIISTVCKGDGAKEANVTDLDILVIHEGVTDRLNSEKLWEKEDTAKLYSSVPFLVRTSGRGRETRRLRNILSFLEFTELSSNTYQGLNKPGLVRALMGASGDYSIIKEKKEEPPL